jgi:hypothetical protein
MMNWPLDTAQAVTAAISSFSAIVALFAFAFTMYKGRYDQIVAVKPALVFVYDGDTGWAIQNIGAGPALNIIVAKKEVGADSSGRGWIQPVRIPPLKKDGIFSIHWDLHNNTHGLGATYQDIWERFYTTHCGNDLNSIHRGQHLRTWREADILAEWKLRKS